MDLTGLRADLDRLLADTTEVLWTFADRDSFIAHGYEWANASVRPVRSYYSVLVPTLTASVPLPADFMGLAEGSLTAQAEASSQPARLERKGVQELDMEWPGWQTADASTGEPRYFRLEPDPAAGHLATLVPLCESPVTVRFEYHPIMPALANPTDVPWGGLYPEHHRLIVLAAEVFARQLEHNPNGEAIAVQRRDRALAEFARAVRQVAPQRSGGVRPFSYRVSRR